MTRYLITGATGSLGRLAVHELAAIEPAAEISALARRDPGTEVLGSDVLVRRGDYDDPPSLRAACEGVDRVLLVSSPVLDPGVRTRQHLAVLDAASAAGVEHVVYTSALGAEHDAGHLRTEQALGRGPTSYTILRNGLYTEPFVTRAWDEATTAGVVRSATLGHALRTASIRDLATAAAHALTRPVPRTTWELNGPGWTYDDLARHLSVRLGRPVRHEVVDDAGMGPFGPVHALFRAGLLAQAPDELTRLIGRRPLPLEDVVTIATGGPPRP